MEYVCANCGRRHPITDTRYQCSCGGYLEVAGTEMFDRAVLAGRDVTIWRYREAFGLPATAAAVSLGEGRTPLIERAIDGRNAYLKLDYMQPTGSFKDRGATVLVSLAKLAGVAEVVEDSSGNAGAAVSAYSAAAGIGCTIYTPSYTPDGKLVQIRHYGAKIEKVQGSRQDANSAVLRAAERSFYASHLWNPYFALGLSSCAFELWEQLGGRAPEAVVLPLGSGGYLEGLSIGFKRLHEAGYITSLPRLYGAQSTGCPPLHEAFQRGLDSYADVTVTSTLAEGIVVQKPPRSRAVLAAIRGSGGKTLCVDDAEILDAMRLLFHMGIYVEPTSAAALAGLRRLSKDEASGAAVLLTGSGLKETAKLRELID